MKNRYPEITRITSIFVIILALASTAAAMPHTHAQNEDEPVYNVQPSVGAPGTEFAFYATGFWDEEVVDIWLNRPDGQVIDAEVEELYKASHTGRADWYWEAPEHAMTGFWQLVARGRSSGIEHVIDFQIQRGAPEYMPPETEDIERTNVHPKQGPPGTEFAFYATGFEVNEDAQEPEDANGEGVKIWVETPDWQRIDLEDKEDSYVAPPNGRVDWTWSAPADAMPGTWHMVILGRESELNHTIPFEVVAP